MRLFELRSLVATTAFLCRDSTPPRDATSVTGSNAPTCRADLTCLLGTAPGRAWRRAASRQPGAVAGLCGRCRCGGAGCRAINAGRRHARWRAPCTPGEASIIRGSCSRGHPPAAAPSGLCGRRLRGGPAEWTRDWRASPSSARWVHIPPAGDPPGGRYGSAGAGHLQFDPGRPDRAGGRYHQAWADRACRRGSWSASQARSARNIAGMRRWLLDRAIQRAPGNGSADPAVALDSPRIS